MTGVSAKINVALDRLPTFKCLPSGDEHLRGTIHFEDHLDQVPASSRLLTMPPVRTPARPHARTQSRARMRSRDAADALLAFVAQLEEAFLDAKLGQPSRRPVVEMVLPSTLDPTLAPPGKHVCLLFVQYAPYHLKVRSLPPLPLLLPAAAAAQPSLAHRLSLVGWLVGRPRSPRCVCRSRVRGD